MTDAMYEAIAAANCYAVTSTLKDITGLRDELPSVAGVSDDRSTSWPA
jgi:hypothetical protein